MEDKPDEEISVDLSKLWGKAKSVFKDKGETGRKEQPQASVQHAPPAKKNEEISIDFKSIKSKIKGLFGAGESEIHKGGAEEASIDIRVLANFFKKYGIFLIALMPVILSIYIRMQPAGLPITDQWAANSVISSLRSQVASQVNSQYPNLPEANKNSIAESELQRFLQQNKGQVDQQISGASAYFKSFFQNEQGIFYMPDIDPYYWYRYARNIMEKGMIGDEIRDGRDWDNHQLAPLGRGVSADRFHSYFLAYFYMAWHVFNPDLTLMESVMYQPVLIVALSVFFAFLIGRRISGNVGGFFSALMVAVNTSYVGRTLFGHTDTDSWIIFFSLLIAWLFLESFESHRLSKNILFAVLAGFFTGVFSFAWSGWFFISDFLFVMAGITIAYCAVLAFLHAKINFIGIMKSKQIKHMLVSGMVYFIAVGISVSLFHSFALFKNSLLPFSFISIKDPVRSSNLWPNVLTTVAELNEGSYNQVINSMGGTLIWYFGLAGILLTFLKKDSEGNRDIKYVILLGLWVVASSYASLKGIRFTLLITPAFSIAFGTSLGFLYYYLTRWISKELNIHKLISGSIIIILSLLFYINIANASLNAASSDVPLVNDAWYNSLVKIRDNSKENAIITSWWDFGHHFKAIADRPVTFDGTTQESPNSHWVGRMFMINDEEESIGILRMIDCGQNNAYWSISDRLGDIHSSLKILKKIILLEKEDAEKELLESGFSKDEAEKILGYTHCNPPEAFAIASEDMIGKSGVWSHFGSWNFERSDIWFNTKGKSMEEAVSYMIDKFNYSKEKAEGLYFEIQSLNTPNEANAWISPWPGYGGTVGCSRNNESESSVACSNGFQINLTNMDIFAVGQQGTVRPKLFAYPVKDGVKIKEFAEGTVSIGFTLVPKSRNSYEIVLSSPELAGSIFTRMFYMNGHGLKHFDLFGHERGLTGTDIYVYKADWEGGNMTIVSEYLDNLKYGLPESGADLS